MNYSQIIGYKNEAYVRAKIESIEYYPFHLHNEDIEIICVLNGKIKIWDSAASYTLSHGDVYIFNCNDPHKITSDDETSIILTIHINRTHYSQYFDSLKDYYFICDTHSHRDLYSADIKHLRFRLANIYNLYNMNDSVFRLERNVCKLLTFLIENYLLYTYCHESEHPAALMRLHNADYLYKNYSRMYRIVDYVTEHFREKITLQQMADMEFLTTAHLSRYIKETLGLTFSQLVSLTRCEEASRLLSSSNKTVDQIAEEVGFVNRKHLAVHFRKWYNQTPSEYRKTILNDLVTESKISLRPFDYNFAKIILNMYLDEY